MINIKQYLTHNRNIREDISFHGEFDSFRTRRLPFALRAFISMDKRKNYKLIREAEEKLVQDIYRLWLKGRIRKIT